LPRLCDGGLPRDGYHLERLLRREALLPLGQRAVNVGQLERSPILSVHAMPCHRAMRAHIPA
jgi:hypothetical protein